MSRCKTSDQKVGGSNPSRHAIFLGFVAVMSPLLRPPWLCARSSCQETRCSSPIRRERSRQSLLHGGEQPAGDARPRPAVDDRLPGGLPQHVVLGWRKCEYLIQLAGEIGRIAGLEGC